jgi:hypothetical protein
MGTKETVITKEKSFITEYRVNGLSFNNVLLFGSATSGRQRIFTSHCRLRSYSINKIRHNSFFFIVN